MATTQQTQGKGNGNAPGKGSETQSSIKRATEGASAPVRFDPFEGPFSLMRRLTQDMDRMFYEMFGGRMAPSSALRRPAGSEGWWPAVDVCERDGKLVVQADVPGLSKDDLNVEIRDGQLQISGERRQQSERQEGGYQLAERSHGRFFRSVPLPEGIKPEEITARFENGVLEIEMPAPKNEQARRIQIR